MRGGVGIYIDRGWWWWSFDGDDSGRAVGVGGGARERGLHSASCEMLGGDLPEPGVLPARGGSQDAASNCDASAGAY